MKTKIKQVNPLISAQTENWMKENFENLNRAASYVVASAPALYRQTLMEMKKLFTENELRLILDVMNGSIPTPEFPGVTISGNVKDGIGLDSLDEKWEVDGDGLIEKINLLRTFQLHVLEIWANGFWYGGSKDKTQDMDAHIKMLL